MDNKNAEKRTVKKKLANKIILRKTKHKAKSVHREEKTWSRHKGKIYFCTDASMNSEEEKVLKNKNTRKSQRKTSKQNIYHNNSVADTQSLTDSLLQTTEKVHNHPPFVSVV